MKKLSIILAASLCYMLLLNLNANAQSDKPYTEGPVWILNRVQTKPGMTEAYLKNISEHWVKLYQAAKDQGIIMNYVVLEGDAASPSDWDIMFMTEVKNFGALDGIGDKFEALQTQIFGNSDAGNKISVSLNDMRKYMGDKLVQELIFK